MTISALAQVTVREVSPVSANNLVNAFVEPNVVLYSPEVVKRNKLVVMLASKGDVPSDFYAFDSFAAKAGFHVIGLNYNSAPSAKEACDSKTDPACYENVRRQVILGDALVPDIQVDTNHFIVRRLKDLLVYLNKNTTDENWGQFINQNGDIVWGNVIVAGHSEGATNAAYMGKLFKLDRVLCFAPVPEVMQYNKSMAPWVTSDGLTFQYNNYVFYQENDTQSFDSSFYKGIGYSEYGDKTYVEDFPYPFNLSRHLTTRFISDHNHTITIKDDVTPFEPNGVSRFERVWAYMLTNEAFQGVSEFENEYLLYPNPCSDELNIQLKDESIELKWTILNSLGSIVLKGKGNNIKTGALKEGVYFVKLMSSKGMALSRFVKN